MLGRSSKEMPISAAVVSDGSSEPESELDPGEPSLYDVLYSAISATISALGGWQDTLRPDGSLVKEYELGDECLGCLRDLKRVWSRYDTDDDRTVARIFYRLGLLPKELIPILVQTAGKGQSEDRIALACLDLINVLTWPFSAVDELRELDDVGAVGDLTELDTAQVAYKAAILREPRVLQAITRSILGPAISKNRRERTERDERTVNLVLHVFRNLAAIRDPVATSLSSSETITHSTLQSDLIVQYHHESILDVILTIASLSDTPDFNPWNMLALDLLHLLFRTVPPKELVRETKDIPASRLSDVLKREERARKIQSRNSFGRHSRFGTTVAVFAGDQKYNLHKPNAISTAPDKVMDQGKKARWRRTRKEDELRPQCTLTAPAVGCLQGAAKTFIEKCFNTFIASIIKDMRAERPKVTQTDYARLLFMTRFFLEYFLLLQSYEKAKGIDRKSEEGHDFDLVAEVIEGWCIRFVSGRMRIAMDEKPPLWMEMHAAVDCFTELLLTIEALSMSGEEQYEDVATVLQNQLYYEGDILDTVVSMLSSYKDQSLAYLDSILHLAFVLLRMLERYSKTREYMYVRKKRAKRKDRKKKGDGEENNGEGEDQGDKGAGLDMEGEDKEDEEDGTDAISFAEHTFTFEKFEQAFAVESVATTCITYLDGYKRLDAEQMKRVVSLLHRMAVRAKADALFFKVSTLELFRRILDDVQSLPRDGSYKDLENFITFILRKFFKQVRSDPLVFVEAFFPKHKGDVRRFRGPPGEDERGGRKRGEKKPPRIKAEIQVRRGLSITQQMGVAVGLLLEMGKMSLLTWIKSALALVAAERHAIVLRTDGSPTGDGGLEDLDDEEAVRQRRLGENPSEEAVSKFVSHDLSYESEEQKEACTRNSEFKLLLRTMNLEVDESDPHGVGYRWTVPASVMPAALDADIKIIDHFIRSPLDSDGKPLRDLVMRKIRRRKQAASSSGSSDGYSSDGDSSSGSSGSSISHGDVDTDAMDDVELSLSETGSVDSQGDPRLRVRPSKKKKKLKSVGEKEKKEKRKKRKRDKSKGDREAGSKTRRHKRVDVHSYVTAQFIEDSDEELANLGDFWEREKARASKAGLPQGKPPQASAALPTAAKAITVAKGGADFGYPLDGNYAEDADGEEDEDDEPITPADSSPDRPRPRPRPKAPARARTTATTAEAATTGPGQKRPLFLDDSDEEGDNDRRSVVSAGLAGGNVTATGGPRPRKQRGIVFSDDED